MRRPTMCRAARITAATANRATAAPPLPPGSASCCGPRIYSMARRCIGDVRGILSHSRFAHSYLALRNRYDLGQRHAGAGANVHAVVAGAENAGFPQHQTWVLFRGGSDGLTLLALDALHA